MYWIPLIILYASSLFQIKQVFSKNICQIAPDLQNDQIISNFYMWWEAKGSFYWVVMQNFPKN